MPQQSVAICKLINTRDLTTMVHNNFISALAVTHINPINVQSVIIVRETWGYFTMHGADSAVKYQYYI